MAETLLHRDRRWFDKDIAVAITLFFVYGAVILALVLLILRSESINIRGVEATIVWFIRRFMLGGDLYPALDAPPFAVNQYTPLYYWISGGILDLIGVAPTDYLNIFRASRIISLSLSVFTTALIFHIARNILSTSRVAAASGAIVAAFWIFPWNLIARSDSLYLLLCTSAAYFFLRYMKEDSKPRLALYAISILITAFFARQSAVCVAGAFIIATLALCRWIEIWKLGAKAIAMCAIALAIVGLLETGEFMRHITAGVANGFEWKGAIRNTWFLVINTHQVSLLVAGLALLTWKTADRTVKALTLVAWGCLIFGAGLTFKWGSVINYFNEFFLFSGLLLATLLDRARSWSIIHSTGFHGVAIGITLLVMAGGLAANIDSVDHLRFGNDRNELRLSAAVRKFSGEGEKAMPVITSNTKLPLFIDGPVWLPQYTVWAGSVVAGAIDPSAVMADTSKAIIALAGPDCKTPPNTVTRTAQRVAAFKSKMFRDFVIVERLPGLCILRHQSLK